MHLTIDKMHQGGISCGPSTRRSIGIRETGKDSRRTPTEPTTAWTLEGRERHVSSYNANGRHLSIDKDASRCLPLQSIDTSGYARSEKQGFSAHLCSTSHSFQWDENGANSAFVRSRGMLGKTSRVGARWKHF